MEEKTECERANDFNRDFFMSDSNDQMEREYDTGDESLADLGGSRNSSGSLHLAMSAYAFFDKSSDNEQSTPPLHVSIVWKRCTCRRVGGNLQISGAGRAMRTCT